MNLSFWAIHRQAIVDAWVARVFDEYPGPTRAFLRAETDPFRNPIGAAFRDALPRLSDQIVGEMNGDVLLAALDDVIRIRAVQDLLPSEAVRFVAELKAVVRDVARGAETTIEPTLSVLDGRIDQVAQLAVEAFARCRQRLAEIRVNEARRQVSELERRSWKREHQVRAR
jgi:hypothetical protein